MVTKDQTLDLQIRNNYIDIYYRGGCLLKITNKKEGVFSFNCDYLANCQGEEKIREALENIKQEVDCKSKVDDWLNLIPFIKQCMDHYFSKNDRSEREFQQLVVRENNHIGLLSSTTLDEVLFKAKNKISRLSDYYICDIEYKTPTEKEVDIIAALLPGLDRGEKQKARLSFIEMKYGDMQIDGKDSGLLTSLKYVEDMIVINGKLSEIKEEMLDNFNQKRELGLMNLSFKLVNFNELKPEFIFLLANHNPRKKSLENEVFEILEYLSSPNYSDCFEIKFAVSTFMGYGLFQENMYSIDDFASIFKKQIYSKK